MDNIIFNRLTRTFSHFSGMYGQKKRKYSHQANMLAAQRPPFKKLKKTTTYRSGVVPGKTRTAGYYGRYNKGSGELKFFDVNIDYAGVVTIGQIANAGSLNNIVQGTGENQRIGRKCTIRSIHWRMQLELPRITAAANPPPGDVLRIILYVDKQCNGAAALATDILETAEWESFRNLANSGRFNILMDRTVNMNRATGSNTAAASHYSSASYCDIQFHKEMNLPLEFNNTTGVITEIRSNNIGALLISRQGVVEFSSKMRLRFDE